MVELVKTIKVLEGKDGKSHNFTNLYLRVNGTLIPIEPKVFSKDEATAKARRAEAYAILKALAIDLPPVEKK